MKISKTVVISALLILVALGAGFFGGMVYQKGKTAIRNGMYTFTQGGQMMRGRFGQNGQNFRPVRGQVLSIDSNGLTVKLSDGSSKIIVVSPSTQFNKSETATASDIKTGDTIMIVGTQNSDGSVTASDVQINPLTVNRPTPTAAQ